MAVYDDYEWQRARRTIQDGIASLNKLFAAAQPEEVDIFQVQRTLEGSPLLDDLSRVLYGLTGGKFHMGDPVDVHLFLQCWWSLVLASAPKVWWPKLMGLRMIQDIDPVDQESKPEGKADGE